MRTLDLRRAALIAELLQRPDPADLCTPAGVRRGHHITQPIDRRKVCVVTLGPAVRRWLAGQCDRIEGAIEGWTPRRRPLQSALERSYHQELMARNHQRLIWH